MLKGFNGQVDFASTEVRVPDPNSVQDWLSKAESIPVQPIAKKSTVTLRAGIEGVQALCHKMANSLCRFVSWAIRVIDSCRESGAYKCPNRLTADWHLKVL